MEDQPLRRQRQQFLLSALIAAEIHPEVTCDPQILALDFSSVFALRFFLRLVIKGKKKKQSWHKVDPTTTENPYSGHSLTLSTFFHQIVSLFPSSSLG